jgi:hypothetical protein
MSQSIPNLDAVLEYAKVMASTEELHPDLVPYVSEGPLGKQLRHPLVYQFGMMGNGWANAYYRQKKADVEKALQNKKYDSFVWLHERPYRIEAFKQIEHLLSDTAYWKLVADIWTDTENQWQNYEEWKDLIGSKRSNRHYMMTEEEDNLLRSLADEVTIYRGCQKGLNENGLSWTLNKSKAQFFANRFGKKGIILERKIPKSDIVAVLTGRGEYEVIWEEKK